MVVDIAFDFFAERQLQLSTFNNETGVIILNIENSIDKKSLYSIYSILFETTRIKLENDTTPLVKKPYQ